MTDLCVSRVPIFTELARSDQEAVARLARPVTFTAGELVSDEVSAPQLLVVHEGRLKAARASVDGSEQLLRVIGPGDFIGEAGVLSGMTSNTRVTALDRTVACAFTHEALKGLLASHPRVMLRMLATMSRRLEQAEDRLAALATTDVTARLAGYLLGLPAVHRDGTATVTLPMAKKDVASLLGTTPESLSRGLTRLARGGLVDVDGGRVTLLDPGGLDRVASN
ncbi:MAG: Crp/Fnr family transcriptional regulator [Candidatus Nanopelagicales bacterium]